MSRFHLVNSLTTCLCPSSDAYVTPRCQFYSRRSAVSNLACLTLVPTYQIAARRQTWPRSTDRNGQRLSRTFGGHGPDNSLPISVCLPLLASQTLVETTLFQDWKRGKHIHSAVIITEPHKVAKLQIPIIRAGHSPQDSACFGASFNHSSEDASIVFRQDGKALGELGMGRNKTSQAIANQR
ncbi:hypothetical protein N657DRAFT_353408 [Parathielavia appendiculata]|uniref:Uncharacterized protein n=1 Tax=Parathielavia appendiculata TaxID=2587402 RepID=A0AAN6U2B3_9PEZI|nr:hypothetical protein N657DRAFT_353408 [Parathielavia appendiculata]